MADYSLNWNPLMQGLDSIREANQFAAKNKLARDQLAISQAAAARDAEFHPIKLKSAQAALSEQQREAEQRRLGGAIDFIHSQSDNYEKLAPEAKAQHWDSLLKSKLFDDDDRKRMFEDPVYGPLWKNPETGYRMLKGLTREHQQKRRAAEAGIAAKEAEAYKDYGVGDKARRGDALEEAIAKLVRENMMKQGEAPAPAPSQAPAIRPQSMPGGPAAPQPLPIAVAPEVTTTDPNIIRTQAAGPQPQQQPMPTRGVQPTANPDDETIVTPFGKMTRGQARTMGGAFLLGGKAEAGKALLEASGAGAERFGKEGENLLNKKVIDATNHVARLRVVEASFDPKFLQIPQRLGFAWDALKDKFGALPPEKAQGLAEFAEFRRASVDNMSRLLNELSGAAVSPQEYERIRATQPDAGTGIADGDSPEVFLAKMKGVMRDQKRAVARYNYLLKHGPKGANPWDVMGLDEIDNVIKKRGAEVDQQLRQAHPKADPAVLDQQRKAIMAKEFGMQI
jgi:hypothetical protein